MNATLARGEHFAKPVAPAPETGGSPLRWLVIAAAFYAIFCHGCHGDHDDELSAPPPRRSHQHTHP